MDPNSSNYGSSTLNLTDGGLSSPHDGALTTGDTPEEVSQGLLYSKMTLKYYVFSTLIKIPITIDRCDQLMPMSGGPDPLGTTSNTLQLVTNELDVIRLAVEGDQTLIKRTLSNMDSRRRETIELSARDSIM